MNHHIVRPPCKNAGANSCALGQCRRISAIPLSLASCIARVARSKNPQCLQLRENMASGRQSQIMGEAPVNAHPYAKTVRTANRKACAPRRLPTVRHARDLPLRNRQGREGEMDSYNSGHYRISGARLSLRRQTSRLLLIRRNHAQSCPFQQPTPMVPGGNLTRPVAFRTSASETATNRITASFGVTRDPWFPQRISVARPVGPTGLNAHRISRDRREIDARNTRTQLPCSARLAD